MASIVLAGSPAIPILYESPQSCDACDGAGLVLTGAPT
jgi:hypothetical protein